MGNGSSGGSGRSKNILHLENILFDASVNQDLIGFPDPKKLMRYNVFKYYVVLNLYESIKEYLEEKSSDHFLILKIVGSEKRPWEKVEEFFRILWNSKNRIVKECGRFFPKRGIFVLKKIDNKKIRDFIFIMDVWKENGTIYGKILEGFACVGTKNNGKFSLSFYCFIPPDALKEPFKLVWENLNEWNRKGKLGSYYKKREDWSVKSFLQTIYSSAKGPYSIRRKRIDNRSYIRISFTDRLKDWNEFFDAYKRALGVYSEL